MNFAFNIERFVTELLEEDTPNFLAPTKVAVIVEDDDVDVDVVDCCCCCCWGEKLAVSLGGLRSPLEDATI